MPNQQAVEGPLRIPVVLPSVQVTVSADGNLAVEVDRERHPLTDSEARRGRGALRDVVNDIATSLDTPVRVELIEHDGTTFTDIVRPQSPEMTRSEPDPPFGESETQSGGFIPHERIDIAVVVAHTEATAAGEARIDLPPSLVSKHPGHIVLLGSNSGTLITLGSET